MRGSVTSWVSAIRSAKPALSTASNRIPIWSIADTSSRERRALVSAGRSRSRPDVVSSSSPITWPFPSESHSNSSSGSSTLRTEAVESRAIRSSAAGGFMVVVMTPALPVRIDESSETFNSLEQPS